MINESNVASAKHISRALLATVIAFILIVCVFTISAFAGEAGQYNVIINDNGYEYTITTGETEPIEILNDANITLGSNDKLNIAAFSAGIGGKIVIDRLNTINIKFNNTIKTYDVYADTVGEAFTEVGVHTEGLAVNYDDDMPIKNGMVITVDSPKIVTIHVDSDTYSIGVIDGTVADVLNEAGVTLGENDYTEPTADAIVADGMEINVFRVEFKTVTKNEKIAHNTKKTEDSSLEKGKTKVEVKGEDGERSVTYRITYVNGRESEKNRGYLNNYQRGGNRGSACRHKGCCS